MTTIPGNSWELIISSYPSQGWNCSWWRGTFPIEACGVLVRYVCRTVTVLGCFFTLFLSLLDPILLDTNHKERIDVWLYKPTHHSVQSWAGRSAQYESITCVRNEVSSSLPFLQQQQLYIFRAIVMDQLEKLPDVPLAPLLPPPLPLPLPRLSKCCCMYVYILFNFFTFRHSCWVDRHEWDVHVEAQVPGSCEKLT